jgi:hypothetical protein
LPGKLNNWICHHFLVCFLHSSWEYLTKFNWSLPTERI